MIRFALKRWYTIIGSPRSLPHVQASPEAGATHAPFRNGHGFSARGQTGMTMNLRLRNVLGATLIAVASLPAGAEPDRSQWAGDLTPIAGADWNQAAAAHLLERAGFGGSPAQIEALATLDPAEAVESLMTPPPDTALLPPFDHWRRGVIDSDIQGLVDRRQVVSARGHRVVPASAD